MTSAWSRLFGAATLCLALLLNQAAIGASAKAISLLAATLDGDLSRVKSLLAAGVDPDIHDDHRNTALIYAARDGKTEIARLLLEAGADAGWIDGERVTPLILASFKNHLDIVQLLLARDVSRTHRDQWGRTALDYALRRGAEDPIAVLLRRPLPK